MAKDKETPKYKDIYGKEYDVKDTIPTGMPMFPWKAYWCARCHTFIKGYDNLPTCPNCGWDKYIMS